MRTETSPSRIRGGVKRPNPNLAATGNRLRKGRVPGSSPSATAGLVKCSREQNPAYELPKTFDPGGVKAARLSYKEKVTVQVSAGVSLG